jgi:hypothetical protein
MYIGKGEDEVLDLNATQIAFQEMTVEVYI